MAEAHSEFDLFLTGQLAQGVEAGQVRVQLAQLFKMPPEKIDALLQSAPVVLKRGLNWDAAKRYRMAIKQAGALSEIRPAGQPLAQNAAPEATSVPESPNKEENRWQLAAVGADVLLPSEKKIVASRLDEFADFTLRAQEGNLLDDAEYTAKTSAPNFLGQSLDLLPSGSDVLAEHERAAPAAAAVVPPSFDIAALGERLSPPKVPDAPAPDVSHLALVNREN